MTKSLIRDMEEKVAQMTIDALLTAGFYLTVNDGEEDTVLTSQDKDAIFKAMMTTDEDYLCVFEKNNLGNFIGKGWVRFIYGNDGWDVINDYTTNLEDALKPVNDFTNQYA